MRIVYIGAERSGLLCLKALLEMRENVVGVFTKHESFASSMVDFVPFDDLMARTNIPFFEVNDINRQDNVDKVRQLAPDLICIISWSWIIGKGILEIPPKGCIGIHWSLLPKRRGGAPINWAIIDGLTKSGITLFYYTEKLDAGDIIAQKKFDIDFEDTSKTVLDKVVDLSANILKENIGLIREGVAPRIPQKEEEATYTKRRKPEDGLIDWSKPAIEIYNWIRALTYPYPCAFTIIDGKKIVIPEAKVEGKKLIFKGIVECGS